MELNIQELDYDYYDLDNTFGFEQEHNRISYEEIPENIVPIKVIKKGVHFGEPINQMNKSIPKENARMVRPKIQNQNPKISYEDILSKMGMFVSEGKLHLLDNNVKQQQEIKSPYMNQSQVRIQQNVSPNSYIYNKYFKEAIQQDNIRRPMTKNDYKKMLLEYILQKERIKQIKSTKLMMPTSNINFASSNSGNLNKLFNFSKR